MTTLRIETPRAFKPLLAPVRYKGARGGRAAAKSHFFAGLTVEESISAKRDIICIREVQKTLRESVKKLIESKIEDMNAGAYFRVMDARIESTLGGVIGFEGMQNHTAESIKSLEGYDRAWCAEAQNISQRSLDILRPTIRKPDSELWFDWNPNFPTDPVDVLLCGPNPPPETVVVSVTYRDNPWLPDVMKKEIEYDQNYNQDKFAHIWLGGYQEHSEARVFKNWKIEEFERPEGTIYRLGADWGYAIDPSCLVRASIDGNRLYVDHEAYMIGCEIVSLPDLFDRVPESRKWFITADSSRPETISHMQKNGYPRINAAVKGQKSVEEGVAFLQSFEIVVHPRCVHLIDELTLYRYRTDPLTGKVVPILEDKNNHLIDSLRYACEGARRAAKPKPKDRSERDHSGSGWMG